MAVRTDFDMRCSAERRPQKRRKAASTAWWMAPSFAQVAIDAGALAATLAAMANFAAHEGVQEQGVKTLRNLSYGLSDKKAERVQMTMAERGALEALVGAINAFPNNESLYEEALKAIANICDKGGVAKKRANSAGARTVVGGGKKRFPNNSAIHQAVDAAFRLF